MLTRRDCLLALFVAVAGSMAASTAAAECLRYGTASVVMTGILEQHTYPGPPRSRDASSGGEADTDYYLRLRAAACAIAGAEGLANAEARKGVWQVQLVLKPSAQSSLQSRLGHSVHVRGRLLSSYTEHHHAPLLLEVVELGDAH